MTVIKLESESFKRIPGYSNYAASTLGRIVDLRSMEEVKFRIESNDGSHVRPNRRSFVSDEGVKKDFRPHTLVLLAFEGPMPERYEMIRHLNDIQTDNSLENLKYGTHAENAQDKILNNKAKVEWASAKATNKEKLYWVLMWRANQEDLYDKAMAANFNPKTCRAWAKKVNEEYPTEAFQQEILVDLFTEQGYGIKEISNISGMSAVTIAVFLYEEGLLSRK